MYKYLVLVVRAGRNYDAYSPDLPGCMSSGDTVQDALANFREAAQMHMEANFEEGYPLPPVTHVEARFLRLPGLAARSVRESTPHWTPTKGEPGGDGE